MTKRRVVITGIGAVTPIGNNVEESWNNLIKGVSGIKQIANFDIGEVACKIAAEIHLDKEFITQYIDVKEQKKVDEFTILSIIASQQAIEDSGYKAESEEQKFRSGVLIGSGIGGLKSIEKTVNIIEDRGPRKVSPFFIPSSLINIASGHISIKYGFMGPNHSVVTACATGTHAIGDSFKLIQDDRADIMICGSAESVVCKTAIAGFGALRALSTNFNDNPEAASRPWDKDRDGFVMGEGAGILVLEEYEHAKKRGAKIYGEVVGYGLSGDAYHITAPDAEGRGSTNAMKMALNDAKINPDQINYINAHGTSTPMGDDIELKTVEKLFGNHSGLSMSSTKSAIGHLLGGAGSVEAIFSTLALNNGIIPPTLNLDNPSSDTKIDLVPHKAKEKKINFAMSNSFGFGGTNASLIFKNSNA
ncbi:beta-ketoacyl-ACP synthase II [Rickettsiales bacterium]|nr:beta-ketoacyl-ACP synthase II [Rickettsiales bacterium]MDB2550488.1 beta-ketoacyl-ACP synthase II [Rickettsiales bacterium]